MMVFCPECGERNDGDALFCGKCGKKLTADMLQQQAQQTKPKGKSALKMVLYGIIGVVVLFVALICYSLATDDNVKSETKVTVQTQAPAGQSTTASTTQQAPANPAQPVQPVNQQTAPPAVATVKIAAVDIGSGFDASSYRVAGKTTSLQAAGLNTIHAVVYVEDVTSPITASGEWIYLGTRESVYTNEVSLSSDGAFHYELSKPSKGWPAGEYALKVYINGQEMAVKKFTVR